MRNTLVGLGFLACSLGGIGIVSNIDTAVTAHPIITTAQYTPGLSSSAVLDGHGYAVEVTIGTRHGVQLQYALGYGAPLTVTPFDYTGQLVTK